MSLKESCLNVVKIMNRYDLVTEKRSEEEINQFINDLHDTGYGGAYPLQIVPFLNPDSTIAIYHYDDCNTYQEEDYYVKELTKIAIHSQGQLNFTDLVQDYEDDGTTTLTYTLNNKAGKLSFNDQDTYDSVPEEYLEFIKTTLNTVSGTHRYLQYAEDVYLVFCLLPIDVINELEAIKANVFSK